MDGETFHDNKDSLLRFTKLYLDGFKSFADRVEIDILPGLTGVVGPNGCGKSNLLEGLRWVLGETSARKMRGGGMDDVIFAGTDDRSARAFARVGLVLDYVGDNPIKLNEDSVLEIVRQIDRGQGTSYKVNGKPTRLKDIQILFQDNASSSNSPAIVSQGRVNSLIQAKPDERRIVLEDAAGVSGLSTRRRDALLKLEGAERNLERVDDSLQQTVVLVGNLKKQARQVVRYREIDVQIKNLIAYIYFLKRSSNDLEELNARKNFELNEGEIKEILISKIEKEKYKTHLENDISLLRDEILNLEKLYIQTISDFESIKNAEILRKKAINDLNARILEVSADKQREDRICSDCENKIISIMNERSLLSEEKVSESDELEEAFAKIEEISEFIYNVDHDVLELSNKLTANIEIRKNLFDKKKLFESQIVSQESRFLKLSQNLNKLKADLGTDEKLNEVGVLVKSLEDKIINLENSSNNLSQELSSIVDLINEYEIKFNNSNLNLQKIDAEISVLNDFLCNDAETSEFLAEIEVKDGWERVVSSIFGDGVFACFDSNSRFFWDSSELVNPEYNKDIIFSKNSKLLPIISHTVFFEDDDCLEKNKQNIRIGDLFVSKTGYFYRWDGLSGYERYDRVTKTIINRNRLEDLLKSRDIVFSECDTLYSSLKAYRLKKSNFQELEKNISVEYKAVSNELLLNRSLFSDLMVKRDSALKAIVDVESTFNKEEALLSKLKDDYSLICEEYNSFPSEENDANILKKMKADLVDLRKKESESKIFYEKLKLNISNRNNRIQHLVQNEIDIKKTLNDSTSKRKELEDRSIDLDRQFSDLKSKTFASSEEAIREAEENVNLCKDNLRVNKIKLDNFENEYKSCLLYITKSENDLSIKKDNRSNLNSIIERCLANKENLNAQILEKLSISFEELTHIFKFDGLPDDVESSEARLAKLEKEKENLGMVNFLAEDELSQYELKLNEIEKSKKELKESSQKLQKMISDIDNEAREKLESAFRLIDGYFSDLFIKLFGGGKAHLKLVNSEDILNAGLEIYACPPGKKLQVLSLMSGGEQALTAMALIFAAFLSNPSPICILDEVDAALDDANTERLCRLIERMSEDDRTRFLLVTHSPLTMAKMNRLYGVTMREKGVSIVTSINLDQAVTIVGND